MIEQWKDIPGFEGYYKASSLGRIQSVSRLVCGPHPGGRRIRDRILHQFQSNHRVPYFQVGLNKYGTRKTYHVHRLVALTWLGLPPQGCEVRHGVNGYSDNSISNLSYGTSSENSYDMERDGTGRHRCVRRGDGLEFSSLKEAAKETSCCPSNIGYVCRGARQTAGGFSWEYIKENK